MKKILTAICAVLCTVMILSMIPIASVSAAPAASAGDYLAQDSIERKVYDELKSKLADISGGKTTSTTIALQTAEGLSWNATQLGVPSLFTDGVISETAKAALSAAINNELNITRVAYRLQADCPYETYWYDPLKGVASSYSVNVDMINESISITTMTVSFSPMAEYAGSDAYTVDSSKIATAIKAIDNAKAIVAQNAALNDRDKLEAYYTKICELVSYDTKAPAGFSKSLQVINVFDGDPTTNVVCEGYAKAFQLLCNLSTFSGKVFCYTVNGTMDGGQGAGAHTWNIVTVNGKAYLTDLTNCDEGTVGQNGVLALANPTASPNERTYSITVNNITLTYTFDELQEDLFCDGYPKVDLANVSNDPVIALAEVYIASPIAGGSPSFIANTADYRYTAKIVSWYDVTAQKAMTKDDVFVEDYKYEATVEFIPAEGFSFDESSKFRFNDVEASVADGTPARRKVTFKATAEVKLMYDINVTGGKAYVDGKEVTWALPGDRVYLVADNPAEGSRFLKWGVTEGGVTLSNAFAASDVFFSMPEKNVKVEAQFTKPTHTHKYDQTKSDAKYLATAATCTAKATYYYSCECGESEKSATHTFEAGELAAHVFDKQVYEGCLATEATCTAAATYYYSCVCGEIEKNPDHTFASDEMGAHVEGEWIIDKEAAPGVEGSKHTECTVCKTTLNTETIPALPAETTTPAETTPPPATGGCGSAIALTSLLTILIPAGFAVAKKKE